jgi:hypothetical protein
VVDLEFERILAIVTQLHPDHWPASVRFLRERIEADQAWVVRTNTNGSDYQHTTQLALALVGRDPDDRPIRPAGSSMRPRSRKAFEAGSARYRPLRLAIMEALNLESVSEADMRQPMPEQRELFGALRREHT